VISNFSSEETGSQMVLKMPMVYAVASEPDPQLAGIFYAIP
jgi:hypothetical protein